ncbi:hypothetical protein C8R43DRAFT_941711 [Mycena crocata]|nr:hypothetical protein C8R43DRAFT_941711 [Mycena crocata]
MPERTFRREGALDSMMLFQSDGNGNGATYDKHSIPPARQTNQTNDSPSHTLFGSPALQARAKVMHSLSPAPQAKGGPVPPKCAFWDWCDVMQVGYPRNFSPPAARWDVPLLWSAKAAGLPVPSFPYTVGRPTVPGTPTQKKYL